MAAVSVGSSTECRGSTCCYAEDVRADTDMNVVMTGDGAFVEVQGTAEGDPFDRAVLDQLLDLGAKGCAQSDQRCSKPHSLLE